MTVAQRIRKHCHPPRFLVAGVAVAGIVGCQNSRYEARNQMRDRYIASVFEGWERLEADRPARIEWVLEAERRLADRRAGYMRTTLQFIDDLERDRRRRWQEFAPTREAWLRDFLHGRPEWIADAFAAMFY